MEKETKKIVLPDGWEIDKVEGNEIILKESKKELPKTWKECYRLLGKGEYISNSSGIVERTPSPFMTGTSQDRNVLPVGLGKPLLALCQLLVCREVYRQGWKPDWDDKKAKYVIGCEYNNIYKDKMYNLQSLLSFQSEEIRDKFLENFRNLIEEAKELI